MPAPDWVTARQQSGGREADWMDAILCLVGWTFFCRRSETCITDEVNAVISLIKSIDMLAFNMLWCMYILSRKHNPET